MGALAIAKREIMSFFVSPLAYIVLTVWVGLNGLFFTLLCFWAAQQPFSSGSMSSPLTQLLGGTTPFYIIVLVFVPLLTMRLLAEETRTGTLETLLTAPVSELEVVLGKFAAAMVFWCTLWVPTLMFAWKTSAYGSVDLGALGAAYFGLFTLGLSWISLGLLMSALAGNQIVAALLTFFALMFHFLVSLGQFVVTEDGWREVFEYVSVWGHLQAYATGMVDSRYVMFDLSVMAFSLFVSVALLQARRYQG